MKMYIIAMLIFGTGAHMAIAQKYSLESGTVSFFSHAAIEDIKADNKKVVSIFNSSNSDLVFSVPIIEFQFEKELMKEHFNEKYMESEKFPKATFQGKLVGYDHSIAGVQNVKATGKLTIHGVTKDVTISGTIEKQGNKIIMKSKFVVKLVDYKIEIPQLLWNKVAEQVEVTSDFVYKPQYQ